MTTKTYKVGETYIVKDDRYSPGVRLNNTTLECHRAALIGKQVVISYVDEFDRRGWFDFPIGWGSFSSDSWELELVQPPASTVPATTTVPSFPEGSLEWAAVQLLNGKKVVSKFGQNSHNIDRLVTRGMPYRDGWKLYVEPPQDYVAKVGTDAWAMAMVLGGKKVVVRCVENDGSLTKVCCVGSITDIANYVGKGLVWELDG